MNSLRIASTFLVATALAVAVMPNGTDAPGASRVGSIVSVAPMIDARSGHSATLLPDGRVLIAGGMRRNQDFYRSAELYDPATGRFQRTGEMNLARVGHASVLLTSGKVLIAGGWIGRGCTDSAELYDPSTGKFAVIARMTVRRGRPEATLLKNGDVLITGGADHDTPGGISSAEILHAATLTFEAIAPMHYARIAHTATLLSDGRVLIAGGRGDSVTSSAELFDPQTKTFVLTHNMITARYKHTAGLLPDGRVLVAGGSDERDWNGALRSAEIFDPRSGKFTATSSLKASRFKLPSEAVRLPSGQLLVAGGDALVEVYQPETGQFLRATGELSNAWHFMCETSLKDGRVLLTGGYPNNDQATNEAWIYRP